jgi:hypothetical protein
MSMAPWRRAVKYIEPRIGSVATGAGFNLAIPLLLRPPRKQHSKVLGALQCHDHLQVSRVVQRIAAVVQCEVQWTTWPIIAAMPPFTATPLHRKSVARSLIHGVNESKPPAMASRTGREADPRSSDNSSNATRWRGGYLPARRNLQGRKGDPRACCVPSISNGPNSCGDFGASRRAVLQGSLSGSSASCFGHCRAGTCCRFTRTRYQSEQRPRMRSTSTSAGSSCAAAFGWRCFQRSRPASTSSSRAARPTSINGALARLAAAVLPAAGAVDGGARRGSPACLR